MVRPGTPQYNPSFPSLRPATSDLPAPAPASALPSTTGSTARDENTRPSGTHIVGGPTPAAKPKAVPLSARVNSLRREEGGRGDPVKAFKRRRSMPVSVAEQQIDDVGLPTPAASQESNPPKPSGKSSSAAPSSASTRKRPRLPPLAMPMASPENSPNPRARKQMKPASQSSTSKRTSTSRTPASPHDSPPPASQKRTRPATSRTPATPSRPVRSHASSSQSRPQSLASRKRKAASSRRPPPNIDMTPHDLSPLTPTEDPLLLKGSEVAARYRKKGSRKISIEPPNAADETIGWEMEEPKVDDQFEEVTEYYVEIPPMSSPGVYDDVSMHGMTPAKARSPGFRSVRTDTNPLAPAEQDVSMTLASPIKRSVHNSTPTRARTPAAPYTISVLTASPSDGDVSMTVPTPSKAPAMSIRERQLSLTSGGSLPSPRPSVSPAAAPPIALELFVDYDAMAPPEAAAQMSFDNATAGHNESLETKGTHRALTPFSPPQDPPTLPSNTLGLALTPDRVDPSVVTPSFAGLVATPNILFPKTGLDYSKFGRKSDIGRGAKSDASTLPERAPWFQESSEDDIESSIIPGPDNLAGEDEPNVTPKSDLSRTPDTHAPRDEDGYVYDDMDFSHMGDRSVSDDEPGIDDLSNEDENEKKQMDGDEKTPEPEHEQVSTAAAEQTTVQHENLEKNRPDLPSLATPSEIQPSGERYDYDYDEHMHDMMEVPLQAAVEDDDEDDLEYTNGEVIINGSDPINCAKIALILKKHGLNLEERIELVRDSNTPEGSRRRRRDTSQAGFRDRSKSRRRSSLITMGDGTTGEVPEGYLLRHVEATMTMDGMDTSFFSRFGDVSMALDGDRRRSAGRRESDVGVSSSREWTKAEWKRFDELFARFKKEKAVANGLHPEDYRLDDDDDLELVGRFYEVEGVVSDNNPVWSRETMLKRVRALEKKERRKSQRLAPPTLPRPSVVIQPPSSAPASPEITSAYYAPRNPPPLPANVFSDSSVASSSTVSPDSLPENVFSKFSIASSSTVSPSSAAPSKIPRPLSSTSAHSRIPVPVRAPTPLNAPQTTIYPGLPNPSDQAPSSPPRRSLPAGSPQTGLERALVSEFQEAVRTHNTPRLQRRLSNFFSTIIRGSSKPTPIPASLPPSSQPEMSELPSPRPHTPIILAAASPDRVAKAAVRPLKHVEPERRLSVETRERRLSGGSVKDMVRQLEKKENEREREKEAKTGGNASGTGARR